MNNIEMYIMVFIEEEEKWYYFKEEFDEDQFINGFTEYYITVQNGIILEDTYDKTNKSLKFANEYDILFWKKQI